ncbi:MAG: OmpA family protein [Deltaproteobacteria bacterium]|nr:MAG: OmpA family protein [Deltaproteobacteria bacterium]
MWALILASALAQDAISMSAVRQVQAGQSPSITFTPGVSGQIDVSLTCAGKRFGLSEAIQPGRDQVLTLAGLPTGTHRCAGSLSLRADDGSTGQMPLNLDVAILAPLSLSVKADELDLDGHSLWLESSRPLTHVSLEAIGEGGKVIGDASVDLDHMLRAEIPWSQLDGDVLQLRIVGTDQSSLKGELVLSPWSYAIPHEDVVFASGKHDIVGAEEPKLESAWTDLQAVKKRFGDIVEMQLFVAGYTDTVGAASSNQALSERRARAIASWFRSRGFSGAIWYQGFGEDALAVGTPDNTDEAANRRALYVVAAERPPISTELPRSSWKKLP